MTEEISESNFNKALEAEKAVIDFWASWCGPCKIMGPRIDELSNEMKNISFYKVNIDNNQALAMKYGIRSIPTLLLMEKGTAKGAIIGAIPKDSLKEKIQHAFK